MEDEEEFDLKSYLDRLHTLKDKGTAPPLPEREKKSVKELDEELEKLLRQTLDNESSSSFEKEEEDVLSSALKRFELCTKDATRDLEPVSEELEKRLNKIMSTKKKKNSSSSYLKLHRALTRSGVQMGVWDISSSRAAAGDVKWTNDADDFKHILQESTNNK